MLQSFISADYLLWAVLYAFYVADNIKLVEPGKLLVYEGWGSSFYPLISFSQYEISGKEIKLPNLFMPASMVFILDAQPAMPPNFSQPWRAERKIRVLRRHLKPLKVVTIMASIALLCGPFLTARYGLLTAIITILPIHVGFLIFACSYLLYARRKFNLDLKKAGMLAFEAVLVPGYLCSLVRRISIRQSLPTDGYQFVLDHAHPAQIEALQHDISRKIDLAMSRYDEGRPEWRELSAYKNSLGV